MKRQERVPTRGQYVDTDPNQVKRIGIILLLSYIIAANTFGLNCYAAFIDAAVMTTVAEVAFEHVREARLRVRPR